MEWQPIETAPKDGTRILISNGDYVCEAKMESREYESEEYVRTERDGSVISRRSKRTDYWWRPTLDWAYDATHWMPLPEPPKTDA